MAVTSDSGGGNKNKNKPQPPKNNKPTPPSAAQSAAAAAVGKGSVTSSSGAKVGTGRTNGYKAPIKAPNAPNSKTQQGNGFKPNSQPGNPAAKPKPPVQQQQPQKPVAKPTPKPMPPQQPSYGRDYAPADFEYAPTSKAPGAGNGVLPKLNIPDPFTPPAQKPWRPPVVTVKDLPSYDEPMEDEHTARTPRAMTQGVMDAATDPGAKGKGLIGGLATASMPILGAMGWASQKMSEGEAWLNDQVSGRVGQVKDFIGDTTGLYETPEWQKDTAFPHHMTQGGDVRDAIFGASKILTGVDVRKNAENAYDWWYGQGEYDKDYNVPDETIVGQYNDLGGGRGAAYDVKTNLPDMSMQGEMSNPTSMAITAASMGGSGLAKATANAPRLVQAGVKALNLYDKAQEVVDPFSLAVKGTNTVGKGIANWVGPKIDAFYEDFMEGAEAKRLAALRPQVDPFAPSAVPSPVTGQPATPEYVNAGAWRKNQPVAEAPVPQMPSWLNDNAPMPSYSGISGIAAGGPYNPLWAGLQNAVDAAEDFGRVKAEATHIPGMPTVAPPRYIDPATGQSVQAPNVNPGQPVRTPGGDAQNPYPVYMPWGRPKPQRPPSVPGERTTGTTDPSSEDLAANDPFTRAEAARRALPEWMQTPVFTEALAASGNVPHEKSRRPGPQGQGFFDYEGNSKLDEVFNEQSVPVAQQKLADQTGMPADQLFTGNVTGEAPALVYPWRDQEDSAWSGNSNDMKGQMRAARDSIFNQTWQMYHQQLDRLGVDTDMRGTDLRSPLYDNYFELLDRQVEELLGADSLASFPNGWDKKALAGSMLDAYTQLLTDSGRYVPPTQKWAELRRNLNLPDMPAAKRQGRSDYFKGQGSNFPEREQGANQELLRQDMQARLPELQRLANDPTSDLDPRTRYNLQQWLDEVVQSLDMETKIAQWYDKGGVKGVQSPGGGVAQPVRNQLLKTALAAMQDPEFNYTPEQMFEGLQKVVARMPDSVEKDQLTQQLPTFVENLYTMQAAERARLMQALDADDLARYEAGMQGDDMETNSGQDFDDWDEPANNGEFTAPDDNRTIEGAEITNKQGRTPSQLHIDAASGRANQPFQPRWEDGRPITQQELSELVDEQGNMPDWLIEQEKRQLAEFKKQPQLVGEQQDYNPDEHFQLDQTRVEQQSGKARDIINDPDYAEVKGIFRLQPVDAANMWKNMGQDQRFQLLSSMNHMGRELNRRAALPKAMTGHVATRQTQNVHYMDDQQAQQFFSRMSTQQQNEAFGRYYKDLYKRLGVEEVSNQFAGDTPITPNARPQSAFGQGQSSGSKWGKPSGRSKGVQWATEPTQAIDPREIDKLAQWYVEKGAVQLPPDADDSDEAILEAAKGMAERYLKQKAANVQKMTVAGKDGKATLVNAPNERPELVKPEDAQEIMADPKTAALAKKHEFDPEVKNLINLARDAASDQKEFVKKQYPNLAAMADVARGWRKEAGLDDQATSQLVKEATDAMQNLPPAQQMEIAQAAFLQGWGGQLLAHLNDQATWISNAPGPQRWRNTPRGKQPFQSGANANPAQGIRQNVLRGLQDPRFLKDASDQVGRPVQSAFELVDNPNDFFTKGGNYADPNARVAGEFTQLSQSTDGGIGPQRLAQANDFSLKGGRATYNQDAIPDLSEPEPEAVVQSLDEQPEEMPAIFQDEPEYNEALDEPAPGEIAEQRAQENQGWFKKMMNTLFGDGSNNDMLGATYNQGKGPRDHYMQDGRTFLNTMMPGYSAADKRDILAELIERSKIPATGNVDGRIFKQELEKLTFDLANNPQSTVMAAMLYGAEQRKGNTSFTIADALDRMAAADRAAQTIGVGANQQLYIDNAQRKMFDNLRAIGVDTRVARSIASQIDESLMHVPDEVAQNLTGFRPEKRVNDVLAANGLQTIPGMFSPENLTNVAANTVRKVGGTAAAGAGMFGKGLAYGTGAAALAAPVGWLAYGYPNQMGDAGWQTDTLYEKETEKDPALGDVLSRDELYAAYTDPRIGEGVFDTVGGLFGIEDAEKYAPINWTQVGSSAQSRIDQARNDPRYQNTQKGIARLDQLGDAYEGINAEREPIGRALALIDLMVAGQQNPDAAKHVKVPGFGENSTLAARLKDIGDGDLGDAPAGVTTHLGELQQNLLKLEQRGYGAEAAPHLDALKQQSYGLMRYWLHTQAGPDEALQAELAQKLGISWDEVQGNTSDWEQSFVDYYDDYYGDPVDASPAGGVPLQLQSAKTYNQGPGKPKAPPAYPGAGKSKPSPATGQAPSTPSYTGAGSQHLAAADAAIAAEKARVNAIQDSIAKDRAAKANKGAGGAGSPFPYKEGGYAGEEVVGGVLQKLYYVGGKKVPESQLADYQRPRSSGGGGGGGQQANPFPYQEGGYAGGGIGPSGQMENKYYKNGGIVWESQVGEYERPKPAPAQNTQAASPFPYEEGGYAGAGIGPSGQLENAYWQNGKKVWESQLGKYERPKQAQQVKKQRSLDEYWLPPMEGESFYRIDPQTQEWATFADYDGDGTGEWGFGSKSTGGGGGGGGSSWRSSGSSGWSDGGSSGNASSGRSPQFASSWGELDGEAQTLLTRALAGQIDWSDPRVQVILKRYGLTASKALQLDQQAPKWRTQPSQPALSRYS